MHHSEVRRELERPRLRVFPLRQCHPEQVQPDLELLLPALEQRRPQVAERPVRQVCPVAPPPLGVLQKVLPEVRLQPVSSRFLVSRVEWRVVEQLQFKEPSRQVVELEQVVDDHVHPPVVEQVTS